MGFPKTAWTTDVQIQNTNVRGEVEIVVTKSPYTIKATESGLVVSCDIEGEMHCYSRRVSRAPWKMLSALVRQTVLEAEESWAKLTYVEDDGKDEEDGEPLFVG